jgi:hypothetical protein
MEPQKYIITDVREFKWKLQVSAGPQPVKHISEFEDLESNYNVIQNRQEIPESQDNDTHNLLLTLVLLFRVTYWNGRIILQIHYILSFYALTGYLEEKKSRLG